MKGFYHNNTIRIIPENSTEKKLLRIIEQQQYFFMKTNQSISFKVIISNKGNDKKSKRKLEKEKIALEIEHLRLKINTLR
jgi:hypothetical protein